MDRDYDPAHQITVLRFFFELDAGNKRKVDSGDKAINHQYVFQL